MLTLFRRPWAALTILAVAALPQTASPAEPSAAAPQTAASARRLDLGAAATRPLADGLRQDLGPLLASAQYQRSKDDPNPPKNRITSVPRVASALRAHQGVAYVALAERVGGGDAVELRALYVLEGAPIGGGATAAPGPAAAPGKAAIFIDLSRESAKPLAASLQGHLGTLLPPAGAGSTVTVEEAVKALEGHQQVAFIVLAKRAGEATVDRSQVFVAPDVLRLSITDDATGSSGEDAPEVELVPDPAGGPPMIKFEFDPKKYEGANKK